MRIDLNEIQHWIQQGSRILDLGCGDGTLLKFLIDTIDFFSASCSPPNWKPPIPACQKIDCLFGPRERCSVLVWDRVNRKRSRPQIINNRMIRSRHLLPQGSFCIAGISLVGLGQNFKTVPFVKPFRSSTVRSTNGFYRSVRRNQNRSVPNFSLRTVTNGTERSMNGIRTVYFVRIPFVTVHDRS